jgi:repressor LexA
MKKLSKRQQEILDYVIAFNEREGRVPTAPEIAQHLGYRNAKTAYQHLEALESKGCLKIHRNGSGRRNTILMPDGSLLSSVSWPVLGSISAGPVSEAMTQVEKRLSRLNDLIPQLRAGDYFMAVDGDAMVNPGLYPGQLVVVRPGPPASPGDICAVGIDGGGTLIRHVYNDGESIRLRAANPEVEEMAFSPRRVKILGTIIAGVAVTAY